VERYLYDPYGTVAYLNGSWGTLPGSAFGWTYLFQGSRLDNATNLDSFRNRDYSPALGRWAEQDPLTFDGGDANLYGYVRDNPIAHVDPSGLVEPVTISALTAKCVLGALLGVGFDIIVQEGSSLFKTGRLCKPNSCSAIVSAVIGCVAAPVSAKYIEPWVTQQLGKLAPGLVGPEASMLSKLLLFMVKKLGNFIPKGIVKQLAKLGCISDSEADTILGDETNVPELNPQGRPVPQKDPKLYPGNRPGRPPLYPGTPPSYPGNAPRRNPRYPRETSD
jgi:RHS repeat-associated protein